MMCMGAVPDAGSATNQHGDAPMHEHIIFKKILGRKDVTIKSVSFDNEGVVLDLRPRYPRPQCSGCLHGVSAVYDRMAPRTWRHLDVGGMALRLRYGLRRVDCPRCGVVVETVPWADKSAWHTRDFEDATAHLAQRCDKTMVTELMRIGWRTVGSIIKRVVARRQDADLLAGLTHIGVDELSYRRHHEYVTVVFDHVHGRVVWAAPGKSAETLKQFFRDLGPERRAAIKLVTADMSAAYTKAIKEAVPQATVAYDRFHVQRLAHDALDAVRRAEVREAGGASEAPELKRLRWALHKNPWNLTLAQDEKLADLPRINERIYRAYLLKESLAAALDGRQHNVARQRLLEWVAWATRSRLMPFKKLAATMMDHLEGILAYVRTGMTNAAVEGMNGKIRTITRRSYGFHNVENLIAMVFLCCSGLILLPVFKYPSNA